MWRAIDALKQKTCTGQVFGGENVALMARFTQTDLNLLRAIDSHIKVG